MPPAAIAAAPLRVEGRFEIGGRNISIWRVQAALALPQEGGDMVVHSSTSIRPKSSTSGRGRGRFRLHAVRVEIRRHGRRIREESQAQRAGRRLAAVAAFPGQGDALQNCAMTATMDMVITGRALIPHRLLQVL